RLPVAVLSRTEQRRPANPAPGVRPSHPVIPDRIRSLQDRDEPTPKRYEDAMSTPDLDSLCITLTCPETIKALILNPFDLTGRPPGIDDFFATVQYMTDHRCLRDYSWVYAIR